MTGKKRLSEVSYTGRVKAYPDGSRDILVCSKAVFRMGGWEDTTPRRKERRKAPEGAADDARAMRRARAQVRELALCNHFTQFVTLTLDAAQVDRYDMAAITRKLDAWLSNQVQRRGLRYVLVPERHKDGAVHFHGFFNDALERSDSGTMVPPEGGRPRRPRSRAQAAHWAAEGWRTVWNLPGWSLGFTTALDLVGEYPRAVSYVCKYIGKQGEKPGGRWYYSGGELARPEVTYADLDFYQVAAQEGAYVFQVWEAGAAFAAVHEPGEGGI